ncbi:MAG: glycosyltransferase [Chloroflexi bacterium]|nr:glycosyltransferase [Chloroflexota bacterium]
MTGAIHQFHPVLAAHDATSDHLFAIRDLARSWGRPAEAFAIEAKPEVAAEVLPYRRLFRMLTADDQLLMHFGLGNDAYDRLATVEAKLALVYHNITPPEFFDGLNPHAALHARKGRAQLRRLAKRVPLAIGVSEYNRRELEAAGFARTAVVPILVDWRRYDVAPDERVLARWRGPATTILFVGRIAPNKRQDELIRLLAYVRRVVDPAARLLLVGGYRDQPQYRARLRALVAELDLGAAVHFTGGVSDAELVACYAVADVFVSLSEHEGFGMPILEAFRFGVPVVARAAGAVAETAGGAAILLDGKDLAVAGEAVGLLRERASLREALVAAGTARVVDFSRERVAARLREVLLP